MTYMEEIYDDSDTHRCNVVKDAPKLHPDTVRLDRLERALIAGAEAITDNENPKVTYIFIQRETDDGDYIWVVRGDGNLREAIDAMPKEGEAKGG